LEVRRKQTAGRETYKFIASLVELVTDLDILSDRRAVRFRVDTDGVLTTSRRESRRVYIIRSSLLARATSASSSFLRISKVRSDWLPLTADTNCVRFW
jgi:hypothetical protein